MGVPAGSKQKIRNCFVKAIDWCWVIYNVPLCVGFFLPAMFDSPTVGQWYATMISHYIITVPNLLALLIYAGPRLKSRRLLPASNQKKTCSASISRSHSSEGCKLKTFPQQINQWIDQRKNRKTHRHTSILAAFPLGILKVRWCRTSSP